MGKTYGSSPTPGEPETKTERMKPATVDKKDEYATKDFVRKEVGEIFALALFAILITAMAVVCVTHEGLEREFKNADQDLMRSLNRQRDDIRTLTERITRLESTPPPQATLPEGTQKAVEALQSALGKYATSTVAYHKDLIDFAKTADALKSTITPRAEIKKQPAAPFVITSDNYNPEPFLLKLGQPIESGAMIILGKRNGVTRWAVMQSDCNFVVYEEAPSKAVGMKAIWATGTNLAGENHRCRLYFERRLSVLNFKWLNWLNVCKEERCDMFPSNYKESNVESTHARMSFDSITTDTGVALVSF